MELVLDLKAKGNKKFGDGDYSQACVIYGQCLEAMMEADKSDQTLSRALITMKPVIFLNLAAANMKLYSWDGARRLCNAALIFCKHPNLALDDLGIDNDISEDFDLEYDHNVEQNVNVIAKAFFRRGQCWKELGDVEKAFNDMCSALRFCPSDRAIEKAVKSLEKKIKFLDRFVNLFLRQNI